jgi:hypothetical protein
MYHTTEAAFIGFYIGRIIHKSIPSDSPIRDDKSHQARDRMGLYDVVKPRNEHHLDMDEGLGGS